MISLTEQKEYVRDHVLSSLERYWPKQQHHISTLPIPGIPITQACVLPEYVMISLPDWADQTGVDGALLVPRAACQSDENPDWQQVDWWLAAFLMLECWPERDFEQKNGPIHSYSMRLKGFDPRVWDRAWVNRIALFLRAWTGFETDTDPNLLFGPAPEAKITFTHDVDAVTKTLAIRLKQGGFNLVNCVRHAVGIEFGNALKDLRTASGFLFRRDDWWVFDWLLLQEKTCNINAVFNFYADTRQKNIRRWLFDPGYDISDEKLQNLVESIRQSNGTIGLHPSFDSWNDSRLIHSQKQHLESISGMPVNSCRQHWLRFGWTQTWAAQEQAGLELDTTLMFNDRPGFRNAAAVIWRPWNSRIERPHTIKAMPTLFMDSQFYDYHSMTAEERFNAMCYWLDEVHQVGGQVAVLWHPHTLSTDYGWRAGFADLLKIYTKESPCPDS